MLYTTDPAARDHTRGIVWRHTVHTAAAAASVHVPVSIFNLKGDSISARFETGFYEFCCRLRECDGCAREKSMLRGTIAVMANIDSNENITSEPVTSLETLSFLLLHIKLALTNIAAKALCGNVSGLLYINRSLRW
jgi:hypothetical protein